MPSDPQEQQWERSGLLSPGDPGRRALLAWLAGQGVPPEEMERAHAAGRLFALAGDRAISPPGRRRTGEQAAAELGADPRLVRRAWLALGLPDPVEPVLGDADVAGLRTVLDVAALVGEEAALTLARVLGAGLARLADAESAVMRSAEGIDLGQTGDELRTAQAWQQVAGVVPRVGALLDAAHRHHVEAARRHWEQVLVDGVVRAGVGFADLSGFTALSARTTLDELATLLSAFDATASEVVQAGGGRVVKFLGDAVMFVAADPDALVAVALELVHHPKAAAHGLQVRAAVAAGELVAQEGDWYGPPVNLAARLVGVARPGQLLAAADPALRLSDRYRATACPPVVLRGVEEPVTAYEVVRRAVRSPLAAPELAAVLARLPAWSGSTDRISRTARLDDALRQRVADVADALDHHPVLEELPDGTTRLVLWTHVRGAVTELDVALAERLDALLDAVPDPCAAPPGG